MLYKGDFEGFEMRVFRKEKYSNLTRALRDSSQSTHPNDSNAQVLQQLHTLGIHGLNLDASESLLIQGLKNSEDGNLRDLEPVLQELSTHTQTLQVNEIQVLAEWIASAAPKTLQENVFSLVMSKLPSLDVSQELKKDDFVKGSLRKMAEREANIPWSDPPRNLGFEVIENTQPVVNSATPSSANPLLKKVIAELIEQFKPKSEALDTAKNLYQEAVEAGQINVASLNQFIWACKDANLPRSKVLAQWLELDGRYPQAANVSLALKANFLKDDLYAGEFQYEVIDLFEGLNEAQKQVLNEVSAWELDRAGYLSQLTREQL